MRPFQQFRALFSKQEGGGELRSALIRFLDATCQQLSETDNPEKKQALLGQIEELLCSEDASIRQASLRWIILAFVKHRSIPASVQTDLFRLIRPFKMPWLAYPLLDWLNIPGSAQRNGVLQWLAELDYTNHLERSHVIDALLNRYLHAQSCEPLLVSALHRLDVMDGGVTDLALHYFPSKTVEQNLRIIYLLGQMERYRVVKPLIAFCQEFQEYLRPVMRALSKFDYDEADQFYIRCLDKATKAPPMGLMEAIRQVRKRRLRKAIPLLDALFPMEESSNPLVNQAINGEIALTMGSFGAYTWARERLLPEIMLHGIHPKYLQAIDRLNLVEAIPLLKAIILMPETPEISLIQHQAYQVCERLLIHQRT